MELGGTYLRGVLEVWCGIVLHLVGGAPLWDFGVFCEGCCMRIESNWRLWSSWEII